MKHKTPNPRNNFNGRPMVPVSAVNSISYNLVRYETGQLMVESGGLGYVVLEESFNAFLEECFVRGVSLREKKLA